MKDNLRIFGLGETEQRYRAMLEILAKAIEMHKTTGTQIGFNVLGTNNPKALSNRLPPSGDRTASEDSLHLVDQLSHALADPVLIAEHGVYQIVYNPDEDVTPRFDFYLVKVPVGSPATDLLDLL